MRDYFVLYENETDEVLKLILMMMPELQWSSPSMTIRLPEFSSSRHLQTSWIYRDHDCYSATIL